MTNYTKKKSVTKKKMKPANVEKNMEVKKKESLGRIFRVTNPWLQNTRTH